MRSLWCGPGFTFGFRREGNTAFLTEQSLALGFQTYVIPPLVDGGEPVSSTRIRGLLARGDVAGAAHLLGRRFELHGTIVHGAGRGHSLGFPTANLSPWAESVVPMNGIYATRTTGADGRLASVTSIGIRPTFAEQSPATTIETYLLDYDGDVYGRELGLEFHARLRDELRFENAGALQDQIRRDVDQARSILQEAA
jgi:riboflavin kinase/FMN adenylyltransferase